jgi:hypothetical protein
MMNVDKVADKIKYPGDIVQYLIVVAGVNN